MQYIHVQNQQEYDQLMDIFEKKGWTWCTGRFPKSYLYDDGRIYIQNNDCFCSSNNSVDKDIISFQDYLKQESLVALTDDAPPLKFGDLVDVRDSDDEEWDCKNYYVGTIKGVHITTPDQHSIHRFVSCDYYLDDFATYKQVRKHEEEKVTITITKSEYEKVKEFLNSNKQ